MSPAKNQPRLTFEQALSAGRQALGLVTIHEERLKHRGINEEFRETLQRAVEILESDTSLGHMRPPLDFDSPRLKAQKELVAWINSFREAIYIRYKDNPAMLQTFGVGLTIDPKDLLQIYEHTKTLLHVARNHLSSVEAAGIVPADLDDAEQMLDHLIAMQQFEAPEVAEGGMRAEKRNARLVIERAIDQLLGAAAMEFRREPRLQNLFFTILNSITADQQ